VPGDYLQQPFRLELQRLDPAQWQLVHDPAGGFARMIWTDGTARLRDFAAMHTWLSTSPDSGFVQVPMIERRDAAGVDVLRGLVLSRIGEGAFTAEPVTDERAWFDLLADVFDVRLDAAAPESRDRLWAAAAAAHRRWEAART
jgi:N-hydroxyarylamine O-acetyltransferase